MASKTKIYIVLEFVTGGELFDKIATRGRLKEDEVRNYFHQLINAVDYCHSRGVFHRDLKPENLLLDASGCLKVSNFGLSALPQQVREDGLLHTTCGTPNYVAPEVVDYGVHKLWENNNIGVFRSIDSGSVKGFPKDADSQNLVCAKNLVIDKSIQKAYIQAIRSAKNFIYIENQYFLGSSYAWSSHKDAGADHLIPVELALKIASKIRANERFSVYIVIPMWPEGVPSSASVQGILFWQVGGF